MKKALICEKCKTAVDQGDKHTLFVQCRCGCSNFRAPKTEREKFDCEQLDRVAVAKLKY